MKKQVPYLLKYSIQRILLLLVTTFIILTITFFLIKRLPDAAITGNEASQFAFCQNQVSKGYYVVFNAEQKGLGNLIIQPYTDPTGLTWYFYRKPMIQQYGAWLKGIFTEWDWGTSSAVDPGRTAMAIILSRIKPTVLINVVSLVIALPLGFAFGIWAALKKNKTTDHIISTLVMVFISVPSFVIISLLRLWLAFSTGWLPSRWPASSATFGEYAKARVIPVLSISFGTIAGFTRYTRAELTEVRSSEFLLLARTKGLTKRQCIIRHALRNSMVPIIPMVIGQFISILSGSIILEQLYSINGIGSLYITALNAKDWNVLLVDRAVYTVIGLIANLAVDLSYGIVDPRIRMGAKGA
mgnify:CR=1 FL=1